MAIRIKRSRVSGFVPEPDDLVEGQLFINLADSKLFAKNSLGEIKQLNISPEAGSVNSVNDVGPDAQGNVILTPADIGALDNKGFLMDGIIDMGGNPLHNLPDPNAAQDPVTLNFLGNLVIVSGSY